MSPRGLRVVRRLVRLVCLVAVSLAGTAALTRLAPGYMSDAGELDPQHAEVVRQHLDRESHAETWLGSALAEEARNWIHGSLGVSRHFEVPVSELIRGRSAVTIRLVATGIAWGWAFSFAAIPLTMCRGRAGEVIISAPIALLLALPVGAMATACLVANIGSPAFVLSVVIAARDFKLVYRIVSGTWSRPHLFYARAMGFTGLHSLGVHVLPVITGELAALAAVSLVLALSACVPIEVIFGVPGLGQLAWSAAMNRDLPVLLAVTPIMATAVGFAGVLADSAVPEAAYCA